MPHNDERDDEIDDDDDAEDSQPGPMLGSTKRTTNGSRARASTGAGGAPATESKAKPKTTTEEGVGQAANDGATVDKKPHNTSQWSREADLMWMEMLGSEHEKCLAKLGKSAYDVSFNIIRLDGSTMRTGTPVCTILGESVMGTAQMSAGDMLVHRIIDEAHLPVSQGPANFEVRATWKAGAGIYGRGLLSLPAPAEIIAVRQAQHRSGSMGAGGMPQQQYVPPYIPQQPQYSQPYAPPPAPPPPAPQPPPGAGYAPPGYAAPHDSSEVGNLRTEVGVLSGAVRELMEFVRGDRRGGGQMPPPGAPPYASAPPPQGVGAMPAPAAPTPPYGAPYPRPGWPPPRTPSPEDDLRDEVAELREDIREIAQTMRGRPPMNVGTAGAPPVAPSTAPPQPAPVPRGPNGEVWVERIGWCVPSGANAAPVAAQPVAQPAPEAARPAGAAPARAGVGATPVIANPLEAVMTRIHTRVARNIESSFNRQIEEVFSGLGAATQAEEPDPTPTTPPEDDKAELEYDIIEVPGTTLFGHPAKYTPNRRTGKIDAMGFVMANPGVMEKGAELAGAAVEALTTLAKKAAPSIGSAVAQTGVGATPPQYTPAPPQQLPAQPQAQPPSAPPEGTQPGHGSSVPKAGGWPSI